jgi:hypothetical protein
MFGVLEGFLFLRYAELLIFESEPPIPVPETQSAFHLLAQCSASRRRDVRLQSRLFALRNPTRGAASEE